MTGETERIADYLDGTMDVGSRARFEAEMLEDETLARAVYRELGVRDALGEAPPALDATAAPVAVSTSRWGWWRWLVPAAAVAAALVIWIRPSAPPGPDVTRGDGSAMQLFEPVVLSGGAPESFTWGSVSGANAYRLEMFDEGSNVVVQTIVSDTTWIAADLPAVLDGTWRVIALRDGREIVRSPSRSLRYP